MPAAAASWAAALVCVALPVPVGLAASGGLLGAGTLLTVWRRAGSWMARLGLHAAVPLLCGGLVALDAALRVAALQSGPVPRLAADGAGARLELRIGTDPVLVHSRGGTVKASVLVRANVVLVTTAEARTRTSSPVVLFARDLAWAKVRPGERVAAVGTMRPGRRSEGTAAVVSVRGPPRLVAPAPPLDRVATAARSGLLRASVGLGPDERALLPGLVDGDTSRVRPDLSDDFRTTGLTHLLAVSGANLAILLAFVLWGARWCGVRGRWIPCCGLATVAAFVVVARPEPSVLRAAAMGLVTLAALGSGRRRTGPSALSAAVIGLLLVEPGLARSYGFVLSVLATGALVLLAGRWTDALERPGLPRPVAVALAAPAAAQLVCAPVVVLLSGQVSLVAVPANLVAAPAVAPATVLGVVALAVGPASPQLAAFVAHLAAVPVWWIARVARIGAQAPHAAIAWPSSWTGACLLALLTVGSLLGLPPVLALVVRRLGRPLALGCAGAVVAGALVSARLEPAGWPPQGWVMVACDIGQGDALVLSVGPGSAVVVDTGPDPRRVDACLRRLHVATVPVLLLTHFHTDHVDGIDGVLRRRTVGAVEVSPLHEPVAQWRAAVAVARGRRIPLVPAVMGEHVQIGPLEWDVLWPARVIRGEGSDPNNASVVLLVQSHGLRLLLTGDVEIAAQRALLGALPGGVLPGGPVDVLKVAHHGSAAQAPKLLAVAAPRAAVVSVGADNDYGHPAPDTMAMLTAADVATWRTDRSGDVAVVATAGGGLRVVGRGR